MPPARWLKDTPCHQIPPGQRELEDSFPYEETSDQRRTIEEVKQDMEQPRPMDRLVCGTTWATARRK